jgi:hypothetical protein
MGAPSSERETGGFPWSEPPARKLAECICRCLNAMPKDLYVVDRTHTKKWTMASDRTKEQAPDDAMRRMDKALKAALKMPPRKHKDEPKRQRPSKTKT